MDKYEYKVRSEEISKLIDKEKYAEAVKIADTIDWRRVKSVTMLLRIAALYRVSRRNDDSREMLLLAYERYPTNRSVVHSLCELSIEMDDVVSAIEYYKQFVKLAPKDSGVYTLRYRILEAQEASLEERIDILEELKKRDYQEEWAYELAYLYHRVGLSTKCVEECDDIILWFGDGPFVMKAMELKAMHVPLTDIQQKNYDIMLGNAAENYSGDTYNIQGYDEGNYDGESNDNIINFDARTYSAEQYADETYGAQESYPEQYTEDSYGQTDVNVPYADSGYGQTDINASYADDGYGQTDVNAPYAGSGYGQTDVSAPYADSGYGQTDVNTPYADSGYGQESYANAPYNENGYSQQEYVSEPYSNNGYDQTEYAAEPYMENGYSQSEYAAEQYPNSAYGQSEDVAEQYPDNGYSQPEYAAEQYPEGRYGQSEYTTEQYPDNDYGQSEYAAETYTDNSSAQPNYAGAPYAESGYGQEPYANEQYIDSGYSQAEYTNEQYADSGYNQPEYVNGQYAEHNNPYVDDGYGNLSYVDGVYGEEAAYQKNTYQDNGYTSEFYVEQLYDENGNLINPSTYPVQQDYSNYVQRDEQADSSKQYRNGLRLVENKMASAGAPGDMSQYNTINLQKVVAESMRELYPDEHEDVFAEDREKYNSGEDIKSITERNTRVFATITNAQTERGKAHASTVVEQEPVEDEEPYGNHIQTGRLAQMVTGVSETAPEPNTGAIKKVYVPGEDARLIKSDSDMNKLRDITEKSVDDEHNWMESNEENVYHEQNLMEMNETAKAPRATGPMKIDDVLLEWERMKLDNAKKHQEEIKQHVLSQTGKIFVNFDNSIKSGILGELEREEEEAQRSSQADKASRKERAARKQFLEADVTGDIPQRQASEDDFDVEYITDQAASQADVPDQTEKTQASDKPAKTKKSEAELRDAYLEMLERVVSRELGKAEEPVEDVQDSSIAASADQGAVTGAVQTEVPAEYVAEAEAYPQETYTEKEVYDSQGYTEPMEYEPTDSIEPAQYEPQDNTEEATYEEEVYEPQNFAEETEYELEGAVDETAYETDLYEQEVPAQDTVYAQENSEGMSGYLSNEYAQEGYAESTVYDQDRSEGMSEYPPNEYAQEGYTESAVYDQNRSEGMSEYPSNEYTQEDFSYASTYASDEYGQEELPETSAYAPEEYTESGYTESEAYTQEIPINAKGYVSQEYTQELYVEPEDYTERGSAQNGSTASAVYSESKPAADAESARKAASTRKKKHTEVLYTQQRYQYDEKALDPEDAQSIAEMAMEDALKTQEIKMNTADLSSLSEKIVATTKKEAKGAKREELREFTPDEQTLFENFAVTKKIKKQIIHALENMTLTAYTGNVIITGDAGLDTVRMAKNLVKEYQASDESFSGKLAKITGEKINQRNIKDVFEKLNNGGIIIEKANGMSEEKLYEMAINLNQENLGIVVIMEDTKKEITKLLEKQAMIADYFNIRIDLMEMDNNALVAYAKNYALALEYSIDELGTLALYTRIANMQSGNHVVTKDEVRDIIDEAIWKSKKSKIKNFVDVLFARRYDNEDMIVLKERDFM